MIKARKRFVLYAMLCVFLLLFVLLGIINAVNFAMAGEDADQVTETLAQRRGMFGEVVPPEPEEQIPQPQATIPADGDSEGQSAQESAAEEGASQGAAAEEGASQGAAAEEGASQGAAAQDTPSQNMMAPMDAPLPMDTLPQEMIPQDGAAPQAAVPGGFFPGFFAPMMPNAQDMENSIRYFTYSFDEEGNAQQVIWQISAVEEDEAVEWARSLLKQKETGWTHTTYRYRLYELDGKQYVTVIDQSRELVPCYRILLISAIGLVVGMVVSCIALMFIGKKLFQPLEEADRKQKRFIADAEKEFKVPLTIINANTEIIERETGETDQTLSINRQVKKMIGLVKNLGTVGVFDEKELSRLECDLSALAQAAGDAMKHEFEEKDCALRIIADRQVKITGDSEALSDLMIELLTNARKFCSSWAELKVGQEDGHDVIIASNDTTLPNGSVDQVFDRFTRLENAEGIPGTGLGLSHVKEIVQAHNARASAKVVNGEFILRINL